jgi:hypothetical protein
MQSFDYEIIYKPGMFNLADPLFHLLQLPEIPVADSEWYIHQIAMPSLLKAIALSVIKHENLNNE